MSHLSLKQVQSVWIKLCYVYSNKKYVNDDNASNTTCIQRKEVITITIKKKLNLLNNQFPFAKVLRNFWIMKSKMAT